MRKPALFTGQEPPAKALACIALLLIALAIAGAFRSYSPVPFWDMWDGYLEFFEKVRAGDWAVWWSQHNEHRIVLARILFWIDLNWFAGKGWFLIVANYILVAASTLMFLRILRDMPGKSGYETERPFLGVFLAAWLFLWCQSENLTWGFQSQFILAQLLPLCAFYWLQKSVDKERAGNFIAACAFGVASVGAMANGVLALPLMTVFALATRQKKSRIAALAVLSAVMLSLYFFDYQAPQKHGSLVEALKADPFGLLHYVLLYIGSPFYYLFGQGISGHIAAISAGALLVIASAWIFFRSLGHFSRNPLQSALLFFILYIGGTAVGTAGGRLIFGAEQALASRYTTPALMAWAALLIIFAPSLLERGDAAKRKLRFALAALMLLMIPLQATALHSRDGELYERSVAALALELHVSDRSQIGHVFPGVDWALSIAQTASADNLALFGAYPYRDVRKQLGKSYPSGSYSACMGALDGIEAIGDDPRFFRVNGWLFSPSSGSPPPVVRILDQRGRMIGYALTGQPRGDVKKAVGKKAGLSGFSGYLFSDLPDGTLLLRGEHQDGPICQLQTFSPQLPFSLSGEKPSPDRVTVGGADILPGNRWLGGDYFKSGFTGMRVYGSLIHSDADTGDISLRMKFGGRIFYRSGPTGGHQFVEIPGTRFTPTRLPVSAEWSLLEFSNPALPKDEFTVRILDGGSGWGEWSAIAVRE